MGKKEVKFTNIDYGDNEEFGLDELDAVLTEPTPIVQQNQAPTVTKVAEPAPDTPLEAADDVIVPQQAPTPTTPRKTAVRRPKGDPMLESILKKEAKLAHINLYLANGLNDQLRDYAKKSKAPVSVVVRLALARYLEQQGYAVDFNSL